MSNAVDEAGQKAITALKESRQADGLVTRELSARERGPIARKFSAIYDRAERQEEVLDAEDSLSYHVRLVLDNDEGLYRRRCELVKEHRAARDKCPFCDGKGQAPIHVPDRENPDATELADCRHCDGEGECERHPHQLGERLKEWAEELAGLEGADFRKGEMLRSGEVYGTRTVEGNEPRLELSLFMRELLSTALAWVDWDRIAANYLSETEE